MGEAPKRRKVGGMDAQEGNRLRGRERLRLRRQPMPRTLWSVTIVLATVLCLIGCSSIIYAYCAKCPCRKDHCAHVVPGKLAAALTNRETSPYTLLELVVVGVFVLLMYGLPLFWLWRSLLVLVPYILLMVFSVFQMQTILCRNCNNIYCPARREAS